MNVSEKTTTSIFVDLLQGTSLNGAHDNDSTKFCIHQHLSETLGNTPGIFGMCRIVLREWFF